MIFRPPSAPQQIVAGLAVFLTGASGPVVPPTQTSATAQALVAYRAPTALAAQPTKGSAVFAPVAATIPLVPTPAVPVRAPEWPYATAVWTASAEGSAASIVGQISAVQIVQMPARAAAFTERAYPYAVITEWMLNEVAGGIAALAPAAAQLSPARTVTPNTDRAWPYAFNALPWQAQSSNPFASQFSIADSDLVFDRLWPLLVAQRAWPYTLPQPELPVPIIAPPVQIQPPPVVTVPPTVWPYWLAQAFAQDTGALPPILGTQIPPVPLAQFFTQTPWPYVGVQSTRANGPAAMLFVPPAAYLGPTAAQPAYFAQWSAVPVWAAAANGPAALAPVAGMPPPSNRFQPFAQAWPYASAALANWMPQSAVPNVPCVAVAQFVTVLWPYARHAALKSGAFDAFGTPAFVTGNDQVWRVDARPRNWLVREH